MANRLLGVDLSHHNSINFTALKNGGYVFVILKATEGENYTDPTFRVRWSAAKSAGLVRGAYHYYKPGQDPIKQANHFCDKVALLPGDLKLVLDVEEAGPDLAQHVWDCAVEIKRRTGRLPIIYASDSFWQTYLQSKFKDFTVWIARYGHAPITAWTLWQFTDHGNVPGATGAVDVDTFSGTLEDLKKLCF